MAINFGNNSALAGFQNALALGADIGGAIRQNRENSALAAFMTAGQGAPMGGAPGTPAIPTQWGGNGGGIVPTETQKSESQAAYERLARINPRLAMQAQDRVAGQQAAQAKMMQEQRAADLRTKAAQGDPVALQQLVGIDLDSWSKLSAEQRRKIEAQTAYTGQAALRISQLPPEQQAAAWDQAIEQGVQSGYTSLADFRGKFSPQALQGAIDNAGLVEKFINLARPDLQAIPDDATLVNVRDPNAVRQFQSERLASQSQKPTSSIPAAAQDYLRKNPSMKADFDAKYGAGASDRVLGGGSGNATGGF